jgi:type VI secretion system protein ImpH
MPASQRRAGAGLIGELLAAPQRFEFFQAVRLIELWQREEAQPQRVRFRNRLSLAFPPNQIENVTCDDIDDRSSSIRITPAFMGLLGSHGVLPLHYSERINRHEKNSNDGGPRAFLDVISHRALGMFYLAWAKHRPECMVSAEGVDEFMTMMTALSGAQGVADDVIDRETLAFYAMQIRARTASAPLMAGMYSEYFDVPFAVEQLVGEWQSLPGADQAQLGVANVDLSGGVLLGARIYGCDARVRLRIGPLDSDGYECFLPGRSGALRLAAMLNLHCGVGMTYEVHLIQRRDDVRGISLDAGSDTRLGISTRLITLEPKQDCDELMYLLHT